jgi:hypothetical protein
VLERRASPDRPNRVGMPRVVHASVREVGAEGLAGVAVTPITPNFHQMNIRRPLADARDGIP